MLPRKRRVSKVLFEEVVKRGKLFSTDFFTTRYLQIGGFLGSRVAVSVSKKVAPGAVLRNSIKRRTNAILQKIVKNIPDSYVVIFFPKKGVSHLSYHLLEKEVCLVLERLQLLKG